MSEKILIDEDLAREAMRALDDAAAAEWDANGASEVYDRYDTLGFKLHIALGGSRWLNGVLEASMQGARVVLLTDAERVRVVAAVNAADMPKDEKDNLLRKLLG